MPNRRIIPVCPKIEALCALVGDFIQYWGFKKVHGQIWSHLFLSPVPLDSTTLAKRLKVSKALVSFGIKDLLRYEVIRPAGKGIKRTVYFESNPKIFEVIATVLKTREQVLLTSIEQKIAGISTDDPSLQDLVEPKKLEQLHEMVQVAQAFLELVINDKLSSDC